MSDAGRPESESTTSADYGFLFVHFREEPEGYAERIFFSLSIEDSPLTWRPLWDGQPVLTSDIGTTGVRDPTIVRDDSGGFHILATDLRVFGGDDFGWDSWRRKGSRSLIVWDSDDLVTWIGPRAVEVAPVEAGMAWAPEAIRDEDEGDYIVFWSSTLYPAADPEHSAKSYSRILFSRTRDFREFSSAKVMLDAQRDIIDTAIVRHDGHVHRVSKHEDFGEDSMGVYEEIGSSVFADDFRVSQTRIGRETGLKLEAPIIIPDPNGTRWFLFLDQYGERQGYTVFETHDLDANDWRPVSPGLVDIPDRTKHGGILRLTRAEWLRLHTSA